MTPPHRKWSHGDRRREAAAVAIQPRWPDAARAADRHEFRAPNCRPGWRSTTTKRHTCGCDECGRDLGYSNHGARTFAQPPQHGQCRHHSLAFQRTDVLCWTVRVLLHRAGAGSRQLAAPADRAEPVSGGAGHAGADRLVVHLPDGRVRSRARRRVRAAPLVPGDLLDGVVLRLSVRPTSTTT